MKVLRSILFALALALTASFTQAQQTKVKVHVPFDFNAGDRTYPAGDYVLYSMSTNSAVIRLDGNPEVQAAYIPTNACADTRPSRQTKLVFYRSGPDFLLYQVWVAGNTHGREFTLHPEQSRLARNAGKADTVTIAASLIN